MSPVIDEEIEEEDDLLTEVFFCIQFILYLLLNKGILTESAFFFADEEIRSRERLFTGNM